MLPQILLAKKKKIKVLQKFLMYLSKQIQK